MDAMNDHVTEKVMEFCSLDDWVSLSQTNQRWNELSLRHARRTLDCDDLDKALLDASASVSVMVDCAKARFLLNAGANVNSKDAQGCTPLHFACEYCWEDENGDDNDNDNHSVTIALDGDLVRLLLDRGADVNARDKYGNTPLYKALSHPEIILDSRVDGMVYRFETPFNVIKLLLDRGSDVNASHSAKVTPLDCAVCHDMPLHVIQLLLDRGADLNSGGCEKMTPLHTAIIFGKASLDVVQLLLDKGADVNAQDDRGQTPLHLTRSNACRKTPQMKYEKCLLENGADPTIREL